MQSKEHKDTKYAWQLERDSDYTSATAFDSIEECIADAQDYFAEENVKIDVYKRQVLIHRHNVPITLRHQSHI